MLTEIRAGAAALSLTWKLVILGALALALAYVGYRAYSWAYDNGVAACEATQAEADRKQREREDAQEAAAKAATTASRTKGEEQRAAAGVAAGKTSKEIQDAYAKNPAAAVSCTPDGRPAAVDPGVRKAIDKAKRAAETAGR